MKLRVPYIGRSMTIVMPQSIIQDSTIVMPQYLVQDRVCHRMKILCPHNRRSCQTKTILKWMQISKHLWQNYRWINMKIRSIKIQVVKATIQWSEMGHASEMVNGLEMLPGPEFQPEWTIQTVHSISGLQFITRGERCIIQEPEISCSKITKFK